MAAAVLRLQAHAGQLQVRLGDAADRRVGLRGGQQQALAARGHVRRRRRRCLQHLEQLFRRLRVIGKRRASGQQADGGNGNRRCQRGSTDEHPYPLGCEWAPGIGHGPESSTAGVVVNGPEGLVAGWGKVEAATPSLGAQLS